MNKYIVKNCPSFVLMQNAKQTYFDVCGKGKIGTLCKDCTDCLLKRIVEKCVVAIDDYMNSKDSDDVSFGMQDMATTILSMLEIEECEE